ncbi:hypothetical protein [Roseomonas chloroacetimidivorans]|uniref:hypothetical protein n=1 Tax=Roseomonas chloroacetimidivorans TaxID=1766656 RepID=UPI003C77CBE7
MGRQKASHAGRIVFSVRLPPGLVAAVRLESVLFDREQMDIVEDALLKALSSQAIREGEAIAARAAAEEAARAAREAVGRPLEKGRPRVARPT